MNNQQAKELVQSTFQQAFNKTRFVAFLHNLLHRFDGGDANALVHINEAFRFHVERVERLGSYTSPEGEQVDLLIVRLPKESKLERARTTMRNFVADYLKNRNSKDAALVAFVAPDEKQWRFSYVKMEYNAVITNGKVKNEQQLTPARRFSYLVGDKESCHTAQSRFVTLLQNTTNPPNLAQIETAFAVESVTKEFFEQYKTLFLDLKEAIDSILAKNKAIHNEFDKKSINTSDFAKKLLGQIVFLYFLQKKGWLGVEQGNEWGTGTPHFLRQLFDKNFGSYKNFFNDILEPLFYDTLATDRGDDAWCDLFGCRIPFLNGGLFEPLGGYDWNRTDIILPNELFSNTDKYGKTGDTGTGILDVFDRYNFTVNESEPLDKEVAIDPEMLGKVFEELLDVTDRKSKGAFYTPREIVHYMCQESLINYLETATNGVIPKPEIETLIRFGDRISDYESVSYTGIIMPDSIKKEAKRIDDKLADIAVCDPAIGSGAFPVGMMMELVRARQALSSYIGKEKRTAYHFKRHAIQNCLYGVDIDLGAVEIAKLRLWLSLVVDEEDVTRIKPLPNLDYKIMTGNSLLGIEKDLFNEGLLKQIEELKTQYFDQSTGTEKQELRQKITDLIEEVTNGNQSFDFKIHFSEVFHKGGFDVVIANPPYKQLSADEPLLPYYKSCYQVAHGGKVNLYRLFFEKGVLLLKKLGKLAYITPDTYLTSKSNLELRKFLVNNVCICSIVHFTESDKVFEKVTQAVAVILAIRDGGKGVFKLLQGGSETLIDTAVICEQDGLCFRSENRVITRMNKTKIRFEDICYGYQGEVNVSTKKEFIHIEQIAGSRPLIRGNQISNYSFAGVSQWCKPEATSRQHFKKRRIVFQEVVNAQVKKRVNGVILTDCFCGHTTNYFMCKNDKLDLEPILGILNSLAVNYYFKFVNQTNHVPIGEVLKIPFPEIDGKRAEQLTKLVQKILTAKSANPTADTSALESEIDRLVYALYALTADEIRIVEGG